MLIKLKIKLKLALKSSNFNVNYCYFSDVTGHGRKSGFHLYEQLLLQGVRFKERNAFALSEVSRGSKRYSAGGQ